MQSKHGVMVDPLLILLKAKIIISKIKNFCIKYWRSLTAGILLIVGFILGKRASSSRKVELEIENGDLRAKLDNASIQKNNEIKIKNDHLEKSNKIEIEKEKNIKNIEKQKEKNIKNLSNDRKILDKILREKYNLKKGE